MNCHPVRSLLAPSAVAVVGSVPDRHAQGNFGEDVLGLGEEGQLFPGRRSQNDDSAARLRHAKVAGLKSDILFLKHSQTVIQPCMWFMEEPSYFSVCQAAQTLNCSIMEKPHTGLDDCLRMLQAFFRKRMSGLKYAEGAGVADLEQGPQTQLQNDRLLETDKVADVLEDKVARSVEVRVGEEGGAQTVLKGRVLPLVEPVHAGETLARRAAAKQVDLPLPGQTSLF